MRKQCLAVFSLRTQPGPLDHPALGITLSLAQRVDFIMHVHPLQCATIGMAA